MSLNNCVSVHCAAVRHIRPKVHQLTGKVPAVLDYQFRPATYTSVIEDGWLDACWLQWKKLPVGFC